MVNRIRDGSGHPGDTYFSYASTADGIEVVIRLANAADVDFRYIGVELPMMDSNNLKQADLITIFGSKGITSEVVNGKRPFSKTHIQRLSERFHVSPDLFLET